MKNLLSSAIVVILFIFATNVSAQKKEKDTKITIKTYLPCEECEEIVEEALDNVAGIHEIEIDQENGKIIVKFDPEKTTADQIRESISESGFDADDLKASEEAFNALPECCKKVETPEGEETESGQGDE